MKKVTPRSLYAGTRSTATDATVDGIDDSLLNDRSTICSRIFNELLFAAATVKYTVMAS